MRRSALPTLLFLLLAAAAIPARAGSVLGDDFNQDEDHDYNGMPKLRLAFGGGFSHWFHDPDSLYGPYERYMQKIENGTALSAQAVWFPWAQGGIGAEWIWFISRTKGMGIRLREGDAGHDLRDRASFVYYGPTFMSRLQFGRFGMLTGAFGAGMLFMRYTYRLDGQAGVQTGSTYAFVPQVGWEYSFYRLLSMGINVRGLMANLTEYEQNGQKVVLTQPIDETWTYQIKMSRIEVIATLVFGL